MYTLPNQYKLLQRHIDSGYENNQNDDQQTADYDLNNLQYPTDQFVLPDILRNLWMDLYNEQNKNHET